jgi:hypothetical protein
MNIHGHVVIVGRHHAGGILELIGEVRIEGRTLYMDKMPAQGLIPGALGRSGLNAIGQRLLQEADVDEIIIQGGVRTTGPNRGRAPRVIRFPKRSL